LALSKEYGLQLDPKAQIWQLSVGEQQRVEIVKMLYRRADVLILDEPTAVLTPQETRELFATLERMKETGRSIIFITHKLEEVMQVADRVTVLRAGRVAATADKTDVTSRQLASLMVGKEYSPTLPGKTALETAPVLTLSDVTAYGDRGTVALDGV
ncbi:MAG TPA: heme ABC transporter ATP-binding protein, partial [Firmicutes bacterium]|nr:heme ABC transporter ATP-binding protein [Bacillota bacterium]